MTKIQDERRERIEANKNKRVPKKKSILTRAQKIADAINSLVCSEYMLTIAQNAHDVVAIGSWIDAKFEARDRLIGLGIPMNWRKDSRQLSLIDVTVNNDQSEPKLGTINANG